MVDQEQAQAHEAQALQEEVLIPGETREIPTGEVPHDAFRDQIGIDLPAHFNIVAQIKTAGDYGDEFFVVDGRSVGDPQTGGFAIADRKYFDNLTADPDSQDGLPHYRIITPEPMLIGREDRSKSFSYSPTTSVRHFTIRFSESDGLRVEDLGSSNGTKLVTANGAIYEDFVKPLDPRTDNTEHGAVDDDITAEFPLADIQALQEEHYRSRLEGVTSESLVDKNGHNVAKAEKAGEYGKEGRVPEDAVLFHADNAIYGVFDGVGGTAHGAADGAQKASEIVKRKMQGIESDDPEVQLSALESALLLADRGLTERLKTSTTATVAKIIKNPDGQASKMAWASVGDSRIYVLSPEGELTQITKDEGHGKYVDNILGVFVEKDPRTNKLIEHPSFFGVKQKGIVDISQGSSVILVTDGITGDVGDQLLSIVEMEEAIAKAEGNAEEVAKRLMSVARKVDDKSVVVIQT